MIRILAVLLAASFLGGCMQTLTGSVKGGESKVFERPPFVVLGKTQYDQNWVDSQIEGGVAAYGWKRPAPRPAYLDAPTKNPAYLDAPTKKPVIVAKPKKPGLIKRIKAKISSYRKPDPVPYVDAPVLPAVVVTAPKPVTRDPVDELLSPS